MTSKNEFEKKKKQSDNSFHLNHKDKTEFKMKYEDIVTALDESNLVSITDSKGIIIFANKQFCDVSEYSVEELIGQHHRIIRSEYHPPAFFKDMWDTISSGKIWRNDIKNKTKSGGFYWVKTLILPIKNNSDEIIKYVSIHTDITRQKEATEQLKENTIIIQNQLEELQIVDTYKKNFTSMVSHELKTPVSSILFWSEFLEHPTISPTLNDEQKKAIQGVKKNLNMLNTLITDLLDSQKLKLKNMQFIYTKINISSMFSEIEKEHSSAIKEKKISLKMNLEKNFTFHSDLLRIRQVFSNIIKNSIDFVPDEIGIIEVGASHLNDQAKFWIKDNGIGIPELEVKNMFKQFYQIDTSITRSHAGIGLGLIISKGIVEGLGGEIMIESEANKGTTISFTIPEYVLQDY